MTERKDPGTRRIWDIHGNEAIVDYGSDEWQKAPFWEAFGIEQASICKSHDTVCPWTNAWGFEKEKRNPHLHFRGTIEEFQAIANVYLKVTRGDPKAVFLPEDVITGALNTVQACLEATVEERHRLALLITLMLAEAQRRNVSPEQLLASVRSSVEELGRLGIPWNG